MRPYRISAGDCIVLEKIGSVVQLTVTLSKRQGSGPLCGSFSQGGELATCLSATEPAVGPSRRLSAMCSRALSTI